MQTDDYGVQYYISDLHWESQNAYYFFFYGD